MGGQNHKNRRLIDAETIDRLTQIRFERCTRSPASHGEKDRVPACSHARGQSKMGILGRQDWKVKRHNRLFVPLSISLFGYDQAALYLTNGESLAIMVT